MFVTRRPYLNFRMVLFLTERCSSTQETHSWYNLRGQLLSTLAACHPYHTEGNVRQAGGELPG